MRISVTAIDGYRFFMNSELPLDSFLKRICREEEFGEPARAGIAFHKLIEDIHFGRQPDWELFTFDANFEIPRVDVMEMPIMRQFGDVTLSGRVDAVRGKQLIDFKTGKNINLERLGDSLQWRCYMAMLPEMETFRFESFRLVINKRKPHGGGRWHIDDHKSMEMRRYDGLEDDVTSEVNEYAEVLRSLAADGHIAFDHRGRPCRPGRAA